MCRRRGDSLSDKQLRLVVDAGVAARTNYEVGSNFMWTNCCDALTALYHPASYSHGKLTTHNGLVLLDIDV